MAGKEEDGPDYEVATEDYMEMRLVLPNETPKDNYRIKVKGTTVGEEKKRLYLTENIQGPPLAKLKLVLHNRDGDKEMEDSQDMSKYSYDFTDSEIHMKQIDDQN